MADNGTRFEFAGSTKTVKAGTVLIVPLIAKPQPPMELIAAVDKLCDDAVSELVDVGGLGDDVGRIGHTTRSGSYRRIVVVSLGPGEKLTGAEVRRAAAATARWLIEEKVARAALWVEGLRAASFESAPYDWATGMALAGYRFDEHRKADDKRPAKVQVSVVARDAARSKAALVGLREAVTLAEAVNYGRQLSQQPANIINPKTLADEARRLANRYKLKYQVIQPPRLKQLGMNGLLAVGQGAEHESRLIRLDYHGATGRRRNIVLVGKAITFDTGGYSIKPSAGLAGLKYDKTGGCTLMGVIRAAAALKLKCNMTVLVAAAENMVSDRAYRPGDIIRMANGKTVEVTNTDAEGRLVLADALWYAQQHCKPTVLIDMATLTGGVGVALGTAAAGLMATDDQLAAALGESGRRTHERLWRLPLWDDYRELMKGNDSDLVNSSAKRDAHCIQGGIFLREFVEDNVPWAHLDIAAVASADQNGTREATGFGVRLLIDYVQQQRG